jgi:hypothetical protein
VGFDGEQCASIRVRTEWQAVGLMFRVLRAEGWEDNQQRVPVTWTPCHLGGGRPWFRCNVQTNGQHCGRRVALLYGAGGPFACRTACRTQANEKLCDIADSRRRGRFELGWEAARTCSTISRKGRGACTGEPTFGFAVLMILPRDAAVADVVGAGAREDRAGADVIKAKGPRR